MVIFGVAYKMDRSWSCGHRMWHKNRFRAEKLLGMVMKLVHKAYFAVHPRKSTELALARVS